MITWLLSGEVSDRFKMQNVQGPEALYLSCGQELGVGWGAVQSRTGFVTFLDVCAVCQSWAEPCGCVAVEWWMCSRANDFSFQWNIVTSHRWTKAKQESQGGLEENWKERQDGSLQTMQRRFQKMRFPLQPNQWLIWHLPLSPNWLCVRPPLLCQWPPLSPLQPPTTGQTSVPRTCSHAVFDRFETQT